MCFIRFWTNDLIVPKNLSIFFHQISKIFKPKCVSGDLYKWLIFCRQYLFHQISKTFKPKCVSVDSKQVTLFILIFIYLSNHLTVYPSLSVQSELWLAMCPTPPPLKIPDLAWHKFEPKNFLCNTCWPAHPNNITADLALYKFRLKNFLSTTHPPKTF